MNRPSNALEPRQEMLHHALRLIRQTSLCFILISLVLIYKESLAADLSSITLIRVGILRDLVAEMPIGRQGLVSSLAVMPLPSLAALPFLPFLSPAAFATAYLYGLALLLALAATPLRALLRQAVGVSISELAPVLLALAAWLLGSTEWSDLLALLAMLIAAVYLETRRTSEIRALAGVCWALVLLSHVVGLLLVALRLVWMGIGRLGQSNKKNFVVSFVVNFVEKARDKAHDEARDKGVAGRRSGDPECRAVHWIQATSILYGLIIYLFLNGMIMGSPTYPFRRTPWWRISASDATPCVQQLEHLLTSRYSDCRPVVSGVWGYAIQPLLAATEGWHVADYHAGKLPLDETGSLVMVIPSGSNPYARFSDWRPDPITAALPICETTDAWTFVRLEPAGIQDFDDGVP